MWLKYITNTEMRFVGYLYIMDIIQCMLSEDESEQVLCCTGQLVRLKLTVTAMWQRLYASKPLTNTGKAECVGTF